MILSNKDMLYLLDKISKRPKPAFYIEENMPSVTELQTKLNDIQTQIDALKDGEKVWPQEGDDCALICDDGSVMEYKYRDEFYGDHSKLSLAQGNLFTTLAAAERERDRRELIVELRKRANGFVADFSNQLQSKSFLNYSYKRWRWMTLMLDDYCPASGYFAAPIDGLIEEFGSRLDLLRDVP